MNLNVVAVICRNDLVCGTEVVFILPIRELTAEACEVFCIVAGDVDLDGLGRAALSVIRRSRLDHVCTGLDDLDHVGHQVRARIELAVHDQVRDRIGERHGDGGFEGPFALSLTFTLLAFSFVRVGTVPGGTASGKEQRATQAQAAAGQGRGKDQRLQHD